MMMVIYEETQGINAFLVDMFLIAQLEALRIGQENITPELFKKIARTEFAPLQPVLNALRSKDANRIRKFDDLEVSIEELVGQHQALIPQAAPEPANVSPANSLWARAAANVRSTIGITEEQARALVGSVMDGSQRSVQALTAAALQRYFQQDLGAEVVSKPPCAAQ